MKYFSKVKYKYFPALLIIFSLCFNLRAEETLTTGALEELWELNLEELLKVNIRTGSLTGFEMARTPAAITVITSEMIAVTPERHIADLIETYVPGAFFNEHLHSVIGMRGVIAEKNYKALLLVNSKNMNEKGAHGGILELNNIDLNDIEKIEIIRGPGAVTYGPGAICGVINIITKTGKSFREGLHFGGGTRYDAMYRSIGGYAEGGYNGDDLDMYLYAGVFNTWGYKDPTNYGSFGASAPSEMGYIEDTAITTDAGVSAYYNDSFNKPQVKAHFDVSYKDLGRIWGRYTTFTKISYLEGGHALGEVKDGIYPANYNEIHDFAVTYEGKQDINKNFSTREILSYDSLFYFSPAINNSAKDINEDPMVIGDPASGNVKDNFKEQDISLKILANYKKDFDMAFLRNIKAAIGGKVTYEIISGTELYGFKGDSAEHGLMIFPMYNATMDDGTTTAASVYGDGFELLTYSGFAEANFDFHKFCMLLASARIDYNKWFDDLNMSPRIAMVSEVYKNHYVKLIWQRSERLTGHKYSFLLHEDGNTPLKEKLTGYEVMYTGLYFNDFRVDLGIFHNDQDVITFVPPPVESIVKIGNLKMIGAEAEITYKTRTIFAGINHTFVKLLDFTPEDESQESGLTLDGLNRVVDVDGTDITLVSDSDALGNMSENISKFYIDITLPFDIILHSNIQLFWGYDYYTDTMQMYKEAYEKAGLQSHANYTTIINAIAEQEKNGYGEMQAKLNVAISWKTPVTPGNLTVSVYGLNLLGFKRYFSDTGASDGLPEIQYIEEPVSVGVKVNYLY
ncbi:MAG: TonB-dependent receptor plug domain-containing protein [bacterium]|nr:TonB-dependent receptor plug domain-containing protein [bacterium]